MMNILVTNLEIIGTICYLAAVLLALRLMRIQHWRRTAIVLVTTLFVLVALRAANIAQWLGNSNYPAIFEDYLEVTIPLLWLLLIYTFIYECITDELRPYRTLFENTGIAITIVEPDGALSLINPALTQLLKLPREQLEGHRHFTDFIDPHDRERALQNHAARLRGDPVPDTYELRLQDADGTHHDTIVNVALIPQTARCVVTVHDITDHKRTQHEANQLAAFRGAVMQTANVWITILTTDGAITFWSEGAERMTGYSADEVLGRSDVWSDMLASKTDHKRAMNAWQELIRDSRPVTNLQLTMKTKDGKELVASWAANAITDPNEQVIGVLTVAQDITRQTEAYQALAEAQEEAAALISFQEYVMQTASVWMTMLDMEGNVTLWNREAERISGYTAEETVGSADIFQKLCAIPEQYPQVIKHVNSILSAEAATLQDEWRIRCKDGSCRTIAWHSAALLTPEGASAGMISIGTDITRRRETEQRQLTDLNVLKALNDSVDSRAMIRGILQAVTEFTGCQMAAIRLRRDDDYPYVEAEGIAPDALQPCMQLRSDPTPGQASSGPGDGFRLKPPYDRLLTGAFDPEAPWFTENGSFWTNDLPGLIHSDHDPQLAGLTDASCVAKNSIAVAIIPLRSAGAIVGLLELSDRRTDRFTAGIVGYLEGLGYSIGVAVQRRMAEEALRRERNFSHSVVDNAQALIIGLDSDARVTLFNSTAADVTGYAAEEVVGRRLWDIMVGEQDLAETAKPFLQILDGDFPKTFESILTTKDGHELLTTWRGTGLVDRDGHVWQVIAIGLDITAHRQLEARIRQSQRMEAIATLAGGITHDFNNILHAVLSNIELMRMLGELNPEQEAKTKAIEQTVKHAAQITKQLATMAAPERPEKGTVDINNCVQNVLALLRGARDQRVTLVSDLQENIPTVLGDAMQIEQVVMNLCVNALQALHGGGELRVSTRREQATKEVVIENPGLRQGEHYVRLDVSDTGVGMTTEIIEQIFDPFFTTRENKGGTGLGLAIVYGIVQAHAGTISVQSEPGAGTTFTVQLPAAVNPVEPVSATEVTIQKGSETILLVEDNEVVRANLTQLLRSLGYNVIQAATGAAAVDIYGRTASAIDLVLLDINMPHMTGVEAFSKIRHSDPDAKGILMTGFVNDDLLAPESIPEGIAGILRKPFTIRELSAHVRDGLAGKHRQD